LDDETLIAVGALARAFAELEDLITLYISRLSKTSESHTAFFLGRMPISQRLNIASAMAKISGNDEHELYKQAFESGFRHALKCRNTVCHGALLGQDNFGDYAFLTNQSGPAEDHEDEFAQNKIGFDVCTYSKATICQYAQAAISSVAIIEAGLGLQSSRERRVQLGLRPHPKARKKPPGK
jgi:hypothetical protein